MSTFNGKMEEIPEISIDRFDGENVNSLVYFLSHCHWDHMTGLNDWCFQNLLIKRPNVYLYVSPISKIILTRLFPIIESKLKELDLYNPTLINIPNNDNKSFSVTPLPAGHCPGSIMFLFESEKNILYTGDYRVNVNDLKKYNAFYSLKCLKTIDSIYLDTTFFKSSYPRFPLREDSINKITELIKEWTQISSKHIIQIIPPANYGSEYLYMQIAKASGMPIHVNAETYKLYGYIPEMDKAITIHSTKTQIHAACGGYLNKICKIINNTYKRVIKPSALWCTNFENEGIIKLVNNNYYKVCYSSHASFEEITEFLYFLKPRKIIPNVVPDTEADRQAMFSQIENIIQTYQSQVVNDFKIKTFKCDLEQSKSNQSDDNSLDGILDFSSTFKRKRFNEDL